MLSVEMRKTCPKQMLAGAECCEKWKTSVGFQIVSHVDTSLDRWNERKSGNTLVLFIAVKVSF